MRQELFASFDNAAWPVLWIDGSGTVLRANNAAVQLFGQGLASGTARLSVLWLPSNPIPPEQFLLQWTRSPSPTVSLHLRARGGQEIRTSALISTWTRGQQRYYLLQFPPGQTSDEGDAQSLKQKLDCLLQFGRTVALDFNNALTTVLGRASLLLTQLSPDHPWRPALLEIEQAAARAAEVAHELGSLSRDTHEPHQLPTGNLNELVQRAVTVVRSKPPPPVVDWEIELERRLFTVRFHEGHLQQAILRVLENAREALGSQGRITVRTRNVELAAPTRDRNVELAAGYHVCLEILDTGCGISPEILPRIFEPFFTTKAAAGHRGLGLAWVYGVLSSHGGGVAVSSQPGQGTSVRLYLPAEPVVAREPAPPGHLLQGDGTVLVVDDDERVLRTVETVLKQFGYRVLTAPGGAEALALLGRPGLQVEIALVDLVMPRMSGRELIERLRQLHPQLPIVPTSGYVWPTHAAGQTQDILRKPFTAQELLWRLREARKDMQDARPDPARASLAAPAVPKPTAPSEP